MRAVKGNKEYTIDESQKKSYQDAGFDILDDDGTVLYYGRSKTIPYDEYMKAAKEIERLQELAVSRSTEIEALRAEIEELRTAKQEPVKQESTKKETAKKAETEKAETEKAGE